MKKPVLGFPTRSDTNEVVQQHKMVTGLKLRKLEGLYYLRDLGLSFLTWLNNYTEYNRNKINITNVEIF